MIKKPAFVTIQESSGCSLLGIAQLILDEFPNIDMNLIEDTESYFVIKFIYDDYIELQEVISSLSYILVQEGILEYITTINCDE